MSIRFTMDEFHARPDVVFDVSMRDGRVLIGDEGREPMILTVWSGTDGLGEDEPHDCYNCECDCCRQWRAKFDRDDVDCHECGGPHATDDCP